MDFDSDGPSEFELDRAEMRRMAERVVEALVERHAAVGEQPAWRCASRSEMRERLPPGEPPREGESFDDIVDHLEEHVLEYAGRIDHPRFFAFVPSSPTWPAILGDVLATGYNVFAGTWLESAGPSAVELDVLGWFREWIGYPGEAAGLLTSGGSAANLTALSCARLHRYGAHDPRAVIYVSEHTHSSIERAARILGFAGDRIRTVPVDADFRMDCDALEAVIARDRGADLDPFLIVETAGTTNTGAVDPLGELAAIARRDDLWLHADAAYGGFAVLCERGRTALAGLEEADSITLDPHKWLYQPYEAGCLLVREGARLERAFHIMPDYLQDTAVPSEAVPDNAEVNFADRGLQLTRAARALKIWLSVRYYGTAAFGRQIERSIELAERAEDHIVGNPKLELVSPARLGIICFRRRVEGAGGEAENRLLVRELCDSGLGMISSTRIRGRYALRFCLLNHRIRWEDVERILVWLSERPTN